MKSVIFSLATALALGACAPIDTQHPKPGDPGYDPPEMSSQCKADQYSRYVGRNRSELPARPANEVWRVTCTNCPVTMDYNPNRLNILFESSTGIIREVKCG